MDEAERRKRDDVHEFWMAFRRDYHKVAEGHRPKLTHEEVEELIYQMKHGRYRTLHLLKFHADDFPDEGDGDAVM
jgi:hypothetical protein